MIVTHAKLSRPTFQGSLAALLAPGAAATLVQVGCGSDAAPDPALGKARSSHGRLHIFIAT